MFAIRSFKLIHRLDREEVDLYLGDRVQENENHFKIVRAMAEGIRKTDKVHLITYHPVGAKIASDFFDEEWLDIDMFQSGHSRTAKEYKYLVEGGKSKNTRPVINGEARYNIPDRFWESTSGDWLEDADVRVSANWSQALNLPGSFQMQYMKNIFQKFLRFKY